MDSASNSTEPVPPLDASPAPSAGAPELSAGMPSEATASGGLGPKERLILWLLISAATVIGLAWVVVQMQTAGFAPVVLMPLLTGIAVAASIEGLARLLEVRLTRRCLAVACVGGLLVVAAENVIDYRQYRSRYEDMLQSNPKMEMFRTDVQQTGAANFGRFMESRLEKWPILWPTDAVLTIVAALGWTLFRLRSMAAVGSQATRTDGKG